MKPRGKLPIDPEKTTEREDAVWDLRVRGRTQTTIAKELGLTQGAVSQILDRMHKRYRKQLDQEVATYNDKHIAQLEKIAEESLKSWENDLKVDRHGNTSHDASYMSTAMTAVENIRKIIGADQKKNDTTSDTGQDPLDRMLAILDAARARRDSATSS